MRFRPCIDIHNGKVKQIVGSSLRDQGDQADENFVSEKPASWYAELYKKDSLQGGHVILLNPAGSPMFAQTKLQAMEALAAAPGTLQIGGGVNPGNAQEYLEAGASRVIVTSWVFSGGEIHREKLREMESSAGREHLVLDLSCRKRDGGYFIVTDRWQKFTNVPVTRMLLDELADSCSEFLIHAADVEGKSSGPEEELAALLGGWNGIPVTYAGGIRNLDDIRLLYEAGSGHLDFTIGSALDLFGGSLSYKEVIAFTDKLNGC